MHRRWIAAALIGGTALIGTAAPAVAAPKPDPNTTVTVTCGEQTFNVVTNDGDWTPAFANGTVYIPVSFGEFHGTGTGPDGTFEFTDPPRTQNANKGGAHARIACTYTVTGVDGPFSFTGTGSVVVATVGKP
jgi:hypothetical protein